MGVKVQYKLRNILAIMLLLSVNLVAFAQFSNEEQKEIDSLSAIVEDEASHDTSLVSAYVGLSEILYVSNLDTIIPLCNRAQQIADKGLAARPSTQITEALKSALGEAQNNMGFYYDCQGDIPLALAYYYKSLTLKEETGDK